MELQITKRSGAKIMLGIDAMMGCYVPLPKYGKYGRFVVRLRFLSIAKSTSPNYLPI